MNRSSQTHKKKKNSEQYNWEERASQLRRNVAKCYWIKETSVWERACRSGKQKLGTCVCSERHREPNQPHAMILLLGRFTLQILRPNAISKGPGNPKKFTHEKTNQHKESIIPIPTLSITDFPYPPFLLQTFSKQLRLEPLGRSLRSDYSSCFVPQRKKFLQLPRPNLEYPNSVHKIQCSKLVKNRTSTVEVNEIQHNGAFITHAKPAHPYASSRRGRIECFRNSHWYLSRRLWTGLRKPDFLLNKSNKRPSEEFVFLLLKWAVAQWSHWFAYHGVPQISSCECINGRDLLRNNTHQLKINHHRSTKNQWFCIFLFNIITFLSFFNFSFLCFFHEHLWTSSCLCVHLFR